MKKPILISVLLLFCLLGGQSFAGVQYTYSENEWYKYKLSPYNSGVDLRHEYAYYWGIDTAGIKESMDSGYVITSAKLRIKDINNYYEPEVDILHLTLFDNQNSGDGYEGIYRYTDTSPDDNHDFFAGYGGLTLGSYSDTNGVDWYDIYEHVFETPAELNTLSTYIANNGYIGYGIDPDCHYYYDGLYFKVYMDEQTNPIPEPGTLILFGTGLFMLAGRIRKRRQNTT